jgi:predicted proteasome-type protease
VTFGDKARNVLHTGSGAGEAKTTDLQIAILVEQKIRGLKVAMLFNASPQFTPYTIEAVVLGVGDDRLSK